MDIGGRYSQRSLISDFTSGKITYENKMVDDWLSGDAYGDEVGQLVVG